MGGCESVYGWGGGTVHFSLTACAKKLFSILLVLQLMLSRWQEGEHAMQGVMRVPDDAGSPSYAVLLVELPQEREVGTNNSAGSFKNPVQLLLFLSLASAKPGREAVHQDAFNGAPVECDEVRCGKSCLNESPEGVETLLCLLNDCCGADGERTSHC